MKEINKHNQNHIIRKLETGINLFCKEKTHFRLKYYLMNLKTNTSYWINEFCTSENNQ